MGVRGAFTDAGKLNAANVPKFLDLKFPES
jgi:hypothetical protein